MHKGCIGEVYNIGGNNENKYRCCGTNYYSLRKTEKDIEYVTDRLGHDRRYAIDAEKMKNEFDWEPKYTFEQGLQETVQWYEKNEEWWKPLKSKGHINERTDYHNRSKWSIGKATTRRVKS